MSVSFYGCSVSFNSDAQKIEDYFLLKKEELIATRTINNFFKAVKEEDFEKQKKLSAEYALDYAILQEFKYYYKVAANKKTVVIKSAKVLEINSNDALGSIYFEENFTKDNGYKFKTLSGSSVILKKIDGNWKITNYEKDGRMLSDILYVINGKYKSQRNIVVSINNFYIFQH